MRTTMKPITLFAEFQGDPRIERRDDGSEVLIQPGYAYVNEVVKGEKGVCLKRSAMEAATPDYAKWGALREMHQPICAGSVNLVKWDDTGAYIEAEVVDPVAQIKVRNRSYRGFSVGVNPTVMRGNDVESCEWVEISLVDRPKDPDAVFVYRADGFDPEGEVEVEVIDDASPGAEEITAPEAPVPDPALLDPSLSSREDAPAAEPASPAAGDSSAERVDLPDASVMRAALVRSGIPEEMLDQLDVAASYATLPAEAREESIGVTGSNSAGTVTAVPFVETPWTLQPAQVLPVERAQTTETVPIRENLEGPAKGTVPMPVGAPPPPKPGTGYPKPSANPPPIPDGMKPKRMRGYVAVLPDGCWGLYRSLDDDQVAGVFLDLSDATEALRRFSAGDAEPPAGAPAAPPPPEPPPVEERAAVAPLVPYEIVEVATGGFLLRNTETGSDSKWDNRKDAEDRLAEITRDAKAEAYDALATQVSRSAERDDVTAALTRAQTAEAELARVRSGHEEALTRLAAAEARVQTLERAPRQKAIFATEPPLTAAVRTYLQNLGREEDVELERMKAAYPDAKAAAVAEAEASDGRDGKAYVQWMTLRAQLAERGVKYD